MEVKKGDVLELDFTNPKSRYNSNDSDDAKIAYIIVEKWDIHNRWYGSAYTLDNKKIGYTNFFIDDPKYGTEVKHNIMYYLDKLIKLWS